MKKKLLLCIFILLSVVKVFSTENKPDSIYYDLCLFLVFNNDITKEYMKEFKDEYSSLIKIVDVSEDYILGYRPDFSKEIGLYKFDFIGRQSDYTYMLIKNKNSYKIYRAYDISLIIKELFSMREENPELISTELFDNWLKEIVKFKIKTDTLSCPIGNNTTFLINVE
jgi:hypothetical protein